MRRLALVLGLVVLAAGCGGGTKVAATSLILRATNPIVGQAVFKLDCPAAGAACAELASDPSLITAPKPFTCLGGPSSWFDMTISGHLAGKPVYRTFSTCWTPQMPTLGKLGLFKSLQSHIVPRRHGIVAVGAHRSFGPGALRPGDLLVCGVPHRHLELGISDRFGSLGSASRGGSDGGATLSGTRHRDGSITASCLAR